MPTSHNAENIDEIVSAALRHFLTHYSSKHKFAHDLQIDPKFLNDVLAGRAYVKEGARRRIAARLGYTGIGYDVFLNAGRQMLGLIPGNPPESLDQKRERRVIENKPVTGYLWLAIRLFTGAYKRFSATSLARESGINKKIMKRLLDYQ